MPMFNFHALLIGVSDYEKKQHFAHLPAFEDVTALRDTLLVSCGYQPENVQALIDEDANLPRVRAELNRLSEVQVTNSTVLIFFSGHGWRLPHTTGEYDEQGYLCLRETDLLDMDGTALSANEFTLAIKAIQAERVVVILDCCHANSTAQIKSPGTSIQWKSGLSEAFYQALSQGGGRVIIASCKDDEKSYVRMQDNKSVFTYHFVESLKGKAGDDGCIRIFDAFHRTAEAVKQEIARALGDQFRQTPIIKAEAEANFPIAFNEGREQQREEIAGQRTAAARSADRGPRTNIRTNYGATINAETVSLDRIIFGGNTPKSGDEG